MYIAHMGICDSRQMKFYNSMIPRHLGASTSSVNLSRSGLNSHVGGIDPVQIELLRPYIMRATCCVRTFTSVNVPPLSLPPSFALLEATIIQLVMLNILSLIAFCIPVFTLSANTQNITVGSNDTSQVTLGGGAGDVPICKVDANGNVISEQAGCYNAPSMCTSSAAMGQDAASFASWKFKGSALYITSLLNSMSPEFTVTIDGSAIDVDGARPGFLPFDCFTLFAKTGLDPNVEHAVNLTIKGPSPNRNMTFPPSTAFSLVNYTYTTSDGTNTTATTTSSGSTPSTSTIGDNSAALEHKQVHAILSALVIVSVALATLM
ncbi:hypothetical protein QCA50_019173 [Cerrena zonata]|uniref:DOMON domain-containing protein n=1 Tax=Cerrena zonata TaxID=2478898 RepID=A0AAW0FBH3_9APHY